MYRDLLELFSIGQHWFPCFPFLPLFELPFLISISSLSLLLGRLQHSFSFFFFSFLLSILRSEYPIEPFYQRLGNHFRVFVRCRNPFNQKRVIDVKKSDQHDEHEGMNIKRRQKNSSDNWPI